MKLLDSLRFRLAALFHRSQLNAGIEDELRSHIRHRADDLERCGLARFEAERRARIEFGSQARFTEECHEAVRGRFVESLFQDLRHALRSLRRAQALAAFVVLTLALGIGMTAGPLSMLEGLIFRPYPVPHPSAVVRLSATTRDSSFEQFSYREYLDIRDHTKSYNGVIASTDLQPLSFSSDPGTTPRVRGGMMVSANYFRVLGVKPRIGRGFRDDEDQVPGRDAVLVLGPEFWRHEFGGDPGVLGRTVRVNGAYFTVIGVAPDTFLGLAIFDRPDFYVPLAMARVFSTSPQKNFFDDRDDRELNVVARLKPDITLAHARGELAVQAQNLEAQYPQVNRGRGAAVYTQFQARIREDDNWKFAVIFVVLALAVLLVACTNVAGLLLGRARARTREFAVRLAMGAGRFRLIRLLLTESLILALAGGLGGIAIGYSVVAWFQSKLSIVVLSDLPQALPFSMDARVLLVSLGLAALSALLCGLAPALQYTRVDLVSGLKAADVDAPGRGRRWSRSVLVVAQVSASLMLLTASFLMARSFQRAAMEGTGFAKEHLLMVRFDPRIEQYSAAKTQQFYTLLTQRVRREPGVVSASLMQNVPLGVDGFDAVSFVPDGVTMPRDRQSFTSTLDTVDEGCFDAIGVPILRGRGFLPTDTADAPRVAIVNEQFAKHYWPESGALGKHIRLDGPAGTPAEIVGVAATIKYEETFEKPMDFIYLPLAQHPVARMFLMVRSSAGPLTVLPAVREIVHFLDPNLPMLQTRSYEDFFLNRAVYGPRIAIQLVGAMGAVALLLALAGLYALVACNVSRRTREIAIRMALGAAGSDVLRLVLGKGLALVALGTAIGLILSVAIERLMNSMLFNSGRVDVFAYLIVVPCMFLVTLLAAYVPARRASRIAPTQALRYE